MINKNTINKIALGDLEINTDYQIIRASNGEEIRLRRKEFQLLKFLANNSNNVINKYVMLDLIWEINSLTVSNTLEVHLSLLRRKLQKISEQVRIDTIRGVGYRLVCPPAAP